MNDVRINIVIISHKQAHMVENLLASLRIEPGLKFHILVIENVKFQPPVNPSRHEFDFTYLQNETPLGLSENINQAFKYLGKDAQYFCILNPDILFQEEIFSKLINAMKKYHLDIISPLVLDGDGTIQDSFRKIPTPKEIILRYLKLKRKAIDFETLPQISFPDWIAGMFMLMSPAAFEEIGGFDRSYKLYFEDVDFCLRAQKKGKRIGVLKDVCVVHNAQRGSHHNLSFLFRHIVSAIQFFRSGTYKSTRKR